MGQSTMVEGIVNIKKHLILLARPINLFSLCRSLSNVKQGTIVTNMFTSVVKVLITACDTESNIKILMYVVTSPQSDLFLYWGPQFTLRSY